MNWRDRFVTNVVSSAAALLLGWGTAFAADFSDPDWPCIQRKVPHLSAGQMWAGPPLDDAVMKKALSAQDSTGLAEKLAVRRTSIEEADALIAEFADALGAERRPEELTALFVRVFARIERERSEIIEGISRYARKQEGLSRKIEAMQDQLTELNSAAEPDLDKVEELEDAIAWDTRIFHDRAQSLTYVCETPVILEQRAFALGRSISALIE